MVTDHGQRHGREVLVEGAADARPAQALHHAEAQQLPRSRYAQLLRSGALCRRCVLQCPRLRGKEQGALMQQVEEGGEGVMVLHFGFGMVLAMPSIFTRRNTSMFVTLSSFLL